MSDEGHLKVAGYVKKQENILSSYMNSLHNLNISAYCTVSLVCVCVCVCVFVFVCGRLGGREGG